MRIIFFAFFVLAILLINSCQDHNDVSFPIYGFDFPKNISTHDLNEFFYPIKDILSSRDSILSYQSHYMFNAYNEENISINPSKVPIIRFTYQCMNYPVIIKLIPNIIIVKEGYTGWFFPEYDPSKLTPTEKLFFFNNYFGSDSSGLSPKRWRKWDSLTKLYPLFKNSAYYNYILNKAKMPITDPLKYHTQRIRIPHSTYVRLVNSINGSGFWIGKAKLDCDVGAFDGGGFWLEINTGRKYNVIFREIGCPTNETKIMMFCQDLMDLAGIKN